MKKVLISMMIVGLLLLPSMVFGQPDQMSTGVPPVAQPLIREGDFAVKLVDILKIGTAKDEAEAETMLSSSGIAPKNGWIADYPVTPDIIGELQSAVGDAADSKSYLWAKMKLLKAFQDLTASLSLSIVADTSGSYIGSEPSISYGDYLDPTVINNYYYDEGPPVVSYYPPPWITIICMPGFHTHSGGVDFTSEASSACVIFIGVFSSVVAMPGSPITSPTL